MVFKLLAVFATIACGISSPTEPRNECEGNILCDQLFDHPTEETGKSVARNESEHLHRLRRDSYLCEAITQKIPPFVNDAPEKLSSVQREYFDKEVDQTFCKNENVSCLGESDDEPSIICKTQVTPNFVTYRIGNEIFNVTTTLKTGCNCYEV